MTDIERIFLPNAPKPAVPYTPALATENIVFVSGNLGVGQNGTLVKGIAAQTKQALENMKKVLEASGSGMNKILKVTVLLADMKYFQEMNKIYRETFGDQFPARTCFAVKELPQKGLVEIECIAVREKTKSKL